MEFVEVDGELVTRESDSGEGQQAADDRGQEVNPDDDGHVSEVDDSEVRRRAYPKRRLWKRL